MVIVSEPRYSDEDVSQVVSASININGSCYEIYYRITGGSLSAGAETFLAATLLPAMKADGSLRITGDVFPKLLESIPRIQEIFHVWDRSFQKISVEAKTKNTSESVTNTDRGVGCFFTGGVDSFYTLLKNRNEITKLIFVHGFDIRLDDTLLRAKVSQAIRDIASKLHKQLIEVETNLREFSDCYVPWKLYHGAALASVALLLSPQLKKVYIAASISYTNLLPTGSHPILDPLWSTEETEIVHDGCEATRIEKVEQIALNDIALKSLRVCWENRQGAYNCCQCEKCLRTMVSLRIAGVLERCTTFKRPLDLEALARVEISNPLNIPSYKENLEAVKRLGNDPALAKALNDCLTERYYRGIRRLRLSGFKKIGFIKRLKKIVRKLLINLKSVP
ncbi:MAG: hypothetical protein A2043_08035 [Candidatus Schekmanbacteria bacterium GWA2_38_9]|nr:MAG: hypothetical protein A2043_08035 [Candidatus Schekmanbacteria bacterium GWA2_38_9]